MSDEFRALLELNKLRILQEPFWFLHMLRRVSPQYCKYVQNSAYKSVGAGETWGVTGAVPADKVKFKTYVRFEFEVQLQFSLRWYKDGLLTFEDDYCTDQVWEPPNTLEGWYPIYNVCHADLTNNDTVSRWCHIVYLYFLVDRDVWKTIEEGLIKPFVKEVIGL